MPVSTTQGMSFDQGVPQWYPSTGPGQVGGTGMGYAQRPISTTTQALTVSDSLGHGVVEHRDTAIPQVSTGFHPPSQGVDGSVGLSTPLSSSAVSSQPMDVVSGTADSESSSSESDESDVGVRVVRPTKAAPIWTPPSSGLEPALLPRADPLDGFPSYTPDVLKRMATGLGLPYTMESDGEPQGILTIGQRIGSHNRTYPALTLPPDIDNSWKLSVPSSCPTFCRTLRVTEEGYAKHFKGPSLDADVARHLPTSAGKAAPDAYSPFWEDRLDNLDTRLRSSMRLSSFAWMASNHLDTIMRGVQGLPSEAEQLVSVLASLVRSQLDVSMSTAKQLVQLRRQNALASLRSVFCSDLTEELKNTQPTSEHLFGAEFCDRVEKLAAKLNNEEAVRDTVQSLKTTTTTKGSKHKKSKKRSKKRKSSGPSAAQAVSSGKASAAPNPSTSGSNPKGKRKAGGQPKQAPPSKKTKRGGKQKRS